MEVALLRGQPPSVCLRVPGLGTTKWPPLSQAKYLAQEHFTSREVQYGDVASPGDLYRGHDEAVD